MFQESEYFLNPMYSQLVSSLSALYTLNGRQPCVHTSKTNKLVMENSGRQNIHIVKLISSTQIQIKTLIGVKTGLLDNLPTRLHIRLAGRLAVNYVVFLLFLRVNGN